MKSNANRLFANQKDDAINDVRKIERFMQVRTAREQSWMTSFFSQTENKVFAREFGNFCIYASEPQIYRMQMRKVAFSFRMEALTLTAIKSLYFSEESGNQNDNLYFLHVIRPLSRTVDNTIYYLNQ